MADLLNENPITRKNTSIKCLEIGTGANCIYPIIGCVEYQWEFVGSEIDPIAINSANLIIQQNPILNGKISIRKQEYQQQQGQQQVEEAPAYQSKANDLSSQSETHFSTAQQLQSEAETEQEDEAKDDPSGAKTQGKQKGYFVGDNLADASSSDEDESTIDKLGNGADKINGMGSTSNDKEVADASSEGADDTNKTLADKLKDSSKTIAAMTGNIDIDDATQSLETKKEEVG
jgi:hypothetical protein